MLKDYLLISSSVANSEVFDSIDDLDDNEDETEEGDDKIGASQTHASSAASGGGTGGSVFYNQPYSLLPSNSGSLTHGRHMGCYDIFPGAQLHSGGQFFRSTKRTQPAFPINERVVRFCLSTLLYNCVFPSWLLSLSLS